MRLTRPQCSCGQYGPCCSNCHRQHFERYIVSSPPPIFISQSSGKEAKHPASDSAGALNFIIWSTTEPAVALICACLPITRSLLATGVSKISSWTGPSWLGFGKSQSIKSTRSLGLSASNRHAKDADSGPISLPFSQDASRKEYFAASGGVRGGKPRSVQQHTRRIDSTYSETYPMADIYSQAETPENSHPRRGEEESASFESGSDKL